MTDKKANTKDANSVMSRREMLRHSVGSVAALAVGSLAGYGIARSQVEETVWQLDPNLCVQCEKCATECVMTPSAVKCVHAYDIYGYCKLCGGYHQPQAKSTDTGAENQLCPTGAIKRTFVEDPFYECKIDEELCIGCAKCVKGCASFGNGSLYLQVRHDRCLNCNECAIAKACPANAYKRVPASKPYILKQTGGDDDAET